MGIEAVAALLFGRRQQLTEAEKKQAREDRLADTRSAVEVRCGIAGEQIAALGNMLYPRIWWRAFLPRPFVELTGSYSLVQLILSCATGKRIECVTLEVAEELDTRDVVRRLARNFAYAIAERLLEREEVGGDGST